MGYKGMNFSLTADELSLLADTSFFERKQQLTRHIVEFLGHFESVLHQEIQTYSNVLPEGIISRRGKISRGENYLGLPYVILDYPATFEKEGIFAFRTMMWWGHPFSCTFHVSGKYLHQYLDALFPLIEEKPDREMKVCINSYQWHHHHEAGNYIPVNEFTFNSGFFKERNFLKLSKTVPLEQSHALMKTGVEFLVMLFNRLK